MYLVVRLWRCTLVAPTKILPTLHLGQGSSTFWVRGPIYIFHIILRAAVIADYKIIMDILSIIIGAWAAPPHYPTLTLLHLRHSSFSNPSAALPTSQLILQPFRWFTYVRGTSSTSQFILQPFRRFTYATAHFTTLPLLHLRHRSFYNPSVASPTSEALHLRHSSFSNPSAASPTPQLILQPFRCFTHVTGHSTTLSLLHLRHRHFTYFTWRAAHA